MLPPRRSAVVASIAPADLGPMMTAEEIRTDPEFFNGKVGRGYVLDHCAPDRKLYIGRSAFWYRGEVRAWWPVYIAQQRERAKLRRRRKQEGDE